MAAVDFAAQPVHYEQIIPPDPAVNVAYVHTIPDNTASELIALHVQFHAGAGIHPANTQVRITYLAARILCIAMHSFGPLGGSVHHLSFALSLAYSAMGAVDLAPRNLLPHRIYMFPGNQIILSMFNDIPDDRFRNISMYLRSWIIE